MRTFYKRKGSHILHDRTECSHYRRMIHDNPGKALGDLLVISANRVPSHHTLCDQCQSIALHVKGMQRRPM